MTVPYEVWGPKYVENVRRDADRHLAHGEDTWPPYEIRLELVEGCPLRCRHCGINGIREPDDKTMNFMEDWVWEKVGEELFARRWKTVTILSGRGEPAMHPHLDRCITSLSDRLRGFKIREITGKSDIEMRKRRCVWMESSGCGLAVRNAKREDLILPSLVDNLYVYSRAGLNCLIVGRREGYHHLWDAIWNWRDLIHEMTGMTVRRGERDSHPTMAKVMDIWLEQDIRLLARDWRGPAECHGGAGAPKFKKGKAFNLPLRPPCYRPIREMNVRWDGKVTLCREDWRGEVCMGDLRTQSLHEIFYSPEFRAARRRAHDGLRDLRPCSACDHVGSRLTHVHKLISPAKPGDRDLIEALLQADPMTEPVLRPWEDGDVFRRPHPSP